VSSNESAVEEVDINGENIDLDFNVDREDTIVSIENPMLELDGAKVAGATQAIPSRIDVRQRVFSTSKSSSEDAGDVELGTMPARGEKGIAGRVERRVTRLIRKVSSNRSNIFGFSSPQQPRKSANFFNVFSKSSRENYEEVKTRQGRVVRMHWFSNRFYKDKNLETSYQRNGMNISLGRAKNFALFIALAALAYQVMWFFQRIVEEKNDDSISCGESVCNVEDDKFKANLVRMAAVGLLLLVNAYLWWFVDMKKMSDPGIKGYLHRSWRGAVAIMIVVVCATQITYNYRVNSVRQRYASRDVTDAMVLQYIMIYEYDII
jgi:hypothetical protein